MKYIIEIEDEPFTRKSTGDNLYVTPNTSAVFDQIEVDNLTPLDQIIRKIDNHSCLDCAFEDVEEWEMPCAKCKRNCKDYWREKK